MTRSVLVPGRRLSVLVAVWLTAHVLCALVPSVSYAQSAKPAPAAKASAPWKFRLEEARIEDIHRAIKSRQITCERLVQAYINRIRAYDGMCVTPVNPNDASDSNNFFPDVGKYTGTPLQPGVMQATVSDPAKLQTYGYIRGVKNAGQLRSLSTVNIRGERSATCKATCDLHPKGRCRAAAVQLARHFAPSPTGWSAHGSSIASSAPTRISQPCRFTARRSRSKTSSIPKICAPRAAPMSLMHWTPLRRTQPSLRSCAPRARSFSARRT
jgi:hypothetical protein